MIEYAMIDRGAARGESSRRHVVAEASAGLARRAEDLDRRRRALPSIANETERAAEAKVIEIRARDLAEERAALDAAAAPAR